MLIDALKNKYMGIIAECEANIEVYLTNPVGIGEHSDILEAIQKELAIIAQYEDEINILRKYFNRSYEVNNKNIPFKNQNVEVGVKKWGDYICKISTHNISYRSDLYSFKTTFKSENDMKRELLEESKNVYS